MASECLIRVASGDQFESKTLTCSLKTNAECTTPDGDGQMPCGRIDTRGPEWPNVERGVVTARAWGRAWAAADGAQSSTLGTGKTSGAMAMAAQQCLCVQLGPPNSILERLSW